MKGKRLKSAALITPRTEAVAAEMMWAYYRDNKALLISTISEHRSLILAEIMAGLAVETVFAPYFKARDQLDPVRRAA